jgi:hypothetical protein
MKLLSLFLVLVCLTFSQGVSHSTGGTTQPPEDLDPHLAHSQREALIKADHKKNIEDAEALLKLAEELKSDLEKEDAHIVSVRSMKKTEDIEKFAKSIRGRLKRY